MQIFHFASCLYLVKKTDEQLLSATYRLKSTKRCVIVTEHRIQVSALQYSHQTVLITKKMRTFFGRAVSIALITVLSDALVKSNRAKFLPYSSPPMNHI